MVNGYLLRQATAAEGRKYTAKIPLSLPPMTVYEAQQQLQTALTELYDYREAAILPTGLMEHVTGLRKVDRILHKQSSLAPDKRAGFRSTPGIADA